MRKLFNFSAGPAVLPEAVLTQAAAEMPDWHGTGMSVMEMSHRGKDYMGIQAQAEADLRELLDIPAEYKVLFLAGGATLQFAALPLNLLPEGGSADYIDTYFARYPKVRDYMETTRETAHKQGYVETLLGRRLYLPDINSKNPQRRQASERLAINAPMQGSAADIIKRAMLAIDRELELSPLPGAGGIHNTNPLPREATAAKNRDDLRLIMQVHDELVFEIRPQAAAELTPRIVALMENAMTLSVPLIVETGLGANWDEAH